jgi:hypothetical protein
MDEKQKQIDELREYIETVEKNLNSAKESLYKLTGEEPSHLGSVMDTGDMAVSDNGKVIEGLFDGENMLGPDGKIFPVPANYASKSKLVEGDRLKLTIAEDGSFIFKQIGPAERKKVIGTLNFEDNAYHVQAEGKTYCVLYASVTYYKAKPGDRVTIVIPANEDTKWGALENVIHEVRQDEPHVKAETTGLSEESFVELESPEENSLGETVPTEDTDIPAV